MSDNVLKLYTELEASDPNFIQFGDIDTFRDKLSDPNNAEKLRGYLKESGLGDEETFGDSASFYNALNPKIDEELDDAYETLEEMERQFDVGDTSSVSTSSATGVLHSVMSGDDAGEIISNIATGNVPEDKTLDRFNQVASETEAVLKKYYNTDNVSVVLGDSGVRSMEDQMRHLQSGASQTPLSLHNFGEAADYQIFVDGKLVDASQRSGALEHSVEPYKILGDIAKKRGLFWGYPHDSGHVASFRYVDELFKNRPELANSEQALQFYKKYADIAPKGLEPVLTTLDNIYGQQSNRSYTGKERADDPLLIPLDPYADEKQQYQESTEQEELIRSMDELGLGSAPAELEGVSPSVSTGVSTAVSVPHTRELVQKTTDDIGYGEVVKFIFDGAISDILDTDNTSGWLYTKEFENLRTPIEFSKNVAVHLAELPAMMALDLPRHALTDPIGTVAGLFHFLKDEGEILLASMNAHPMQQYHRYKGENKKAIKMRDDALKHIFDTGGVYTYFAASGLIHGGMKTKKLASKASEFRDVMEMVNDRPAKGPVNQEMIKAVDAIKKDPVLKEKAEAVIAEQLTLDLIEPAKVDKIINTSEAATVNKQLELLDTKKTIGPSPRKTPEVEPAPISIARWRDINHGLEGTIHKDYITGDRVKIIKETNKSLTVEILDGKHKGEVFNHQKRHSGAMGDTPVINSTKHGFSVKIESAKQPKPTKRKPAKKPKIIKEQGAVQEIKLEKSSDLRVGKDEVTIPGEKARRFKYKKALEVFIEKKMSEHIGKNIVIRHGKTTKGDYLVKVFEKTKEQPLPITATKRPPLKTKTDTQEIVSTMRDPKKRGIENRDILIEKYTEEISEMRRGREAVDSQLLDLKLRQEIYIEELGEFRKRENHYRTQAEKHTKNGDTKKAEIATRKANAEASKSQKYVLDNGVGFGNRIKVMEASINSYNGSISKTKSQLRQEMSKAELAKNTANKVLKLASPGAVGKGKKVKLTPEQIELRLDIAENVKEIWNRTNSGVKMTVRGLKKVLKDEKWDKEAISYAIKEFDNISADVQIQSAKSLARQLDAEARETSGVVRATNTKYRSSDEYIANIKVETIAGKTANELKKAEVDLINSLVEYMGGEAVEAARGTRTIAAIQHVGASKRMRAKVAKELLDDKLSVSELPEKANSVANLWAELIDLWEKNPDNPVNKSVSIKATKMLIAYLSEPARTVRSFRDMTIKDVGERMRKLREEGVLPEDAMQMLMGLLEGTEVNRHWLHKVAEYARNVKLATGSSLIRSFSGNSIGSIDAWARMPLEIGYDYLFGESSKFLHRMSDGKIGNLNGSQMSRLEIGAAWRGWRNGLGEGMRLGWEMLLENEEALRESSFYTREALHHKEVAGKKGMVIRTPQRAQGAIDLLFRVPLTNKYMHRFAVRQAKREGFKTQSEILARAEEIINSDKLSPEMMDLARQSGEYATYQKELKSVGKWVNKLRVGPGASEAAAQIVVPFFNTASNLLHWSLEHSPLEPFTPTFVRALKDAYGTSGSGSSPLAIQMGKFTTGVGTMYILSEMLGLEQEGKITGDWGKLRPEEREMLAQQGMQEYSIKTRDGSVVSFRGFEPISTYLVVADELQRTDILKNATKGELLKASEELYGVSRAFMQSFLENPFVMGVGNLAKTFDGRDDVVHYLVNLAAGSAMPGGLRQMRGIVDPYRRERIKASEWVNDEVSFYDMFMSQVYNVTPWMTDKNLPKLDPFGKVIKNADPVGSLYAWRETQLKPDPVYQEVQRLYFDQKKGFTPATPWFSNDELSKLKLTNDEHYGLVKYSGNWLYNFMNGLLQWEEWKKPTPVEYAAEMISGNKTEYRQNLDKGEDIMLNLTDKQLSEVRKNSMSDYKRRKIIGKARENAFYVFRSTLFAPELSDIEKEMGKLESVDYFKNEEERQAYVDSRRQHYGLDEMGDEEYWNKLTFKINEHRRRNPSSDDYIRNLTGRSFDLLEKSSASEYNIGN